MLLWTLFFVAASIAFVFLILNKFFSEHLTRSSLKDLRYVAHIAEAKLKKEEELLARALTLHVGSQELSQALKKGDFTKVKSLIQNWSALYKIERVSLFNKEGFLVNLSTGIASQSVKLPLDVIQKLWSGYEEREISASKKGLALKVQRRLSGDGGERLGYLVEEKNIPFSSFLDPGDAAKELIVVQSNKIVYTSPTFVKKELLNTSSLQTPSRAFELHLDEAAFDVLRLDLAEGLVFFFAVENLKLKVFRSFYFKYFLYFVLFLVVLVGLFYISYYLQVFRPLEEISKYIEKEELDNLRPGSSVKEIVTISNRLTQKMESYKADVQESKEGRVQDMTRLVASVAHELNNSLSFLGGNIDYLEEEMVSNFEEMDKKEVQDSLSSLRTAYNRIKKIVSDLKVFSSKGELKVEWFPLSELSTKIKNEFDDFENEVEEDYSIHTDQDRVLQILRNLVVNSRQAYENENGRVALRLYKKSNNLVISVQDWAGGISKDVVAKIFQPFYTTKKNKGGAGLGLSLSQSLAKEVGAELSLLETSSRGTVFCIYLKHFRKD